MSTIRLYNTIVYILHAYSLHVWLTLATLAFVVSLAAGAVLHALWVRRLARGRKRAPTIWPLIKRVIINSEERKTWRWLELAFIDCSVMIKMPVTRFSSPNSKKEGVYWFELLSSLYCTFTVVRADGRVMGCVDLPPRTGKLNRSHRMKAAVLRQCGIPYIVLQQGVQPTIEQIRLDFLGNASAMPQNTHQAAAIEAASSSLRSSISRSRQTRHTSSRRKESATVESSFILESQFPSGESSESGTQWQDDSFLVPLDSRRAAL